MERKYEMNACIGNTNKTYEFNVFYYSFLAVHAQELANIDKSHRIKNAVFFVYVYKHVYVHVYVHVSHFSFVRLCVFVWIHFFCCVNRSYAKFFNITWIRFLIPLTMNQVVLATYLLAVNSILKFVQHWLCIIFKYDIEDDSFIQNVLHTSLCHLNRECRYVLTLFLFFSLIERCE